MECLSRNAGKACHRICRVKETASNSQELDTPSNRNVNRSISENQTVTDECSAELHVCLCMPHGAGFAISVCLALVHCVSKK